MLLEDLLIKAERQRIRMSGPGFQYLDNVGVCSSWKVACVEFIYIIDHYGALMEDRLAIRNKYYGSAGLCRTFSRKAERTQ